MTLSLSWTNSVPKQGRMGFHEGDIVGVSLWHNMCLNCIECKTAGPYFCTTREPLSITRPETLRGIL